MTVLMLGRQLELGHYRAEFLQSHGFHVIFPESKSEALAAIQEAAFDAAIISYTLSKEPRKSLLPESKRSARTVRWLPLCSVRRSKLPFLETKRSWTLPPQKPYWMR